MKMYEHGGDVKSFALKNKCEISEVIDLSSNINFLKPEISLDFNALDISAYPSYDDLYKALAKKYEISENQIEVYNGGSSAIFSLFRALGLKHCTIYAPAYLEYKKAAKNFSYTLDNVNRLNNIKENIEENTFVIFVNPSTPDGKYYDIDVLMNYWISKNATILIDESFLDFTSAKSCKSYLNSYDKLYILKSMTKFYSSASIRIGSILSTKENIKTIKAKEPLWKISHFDSMYLQEALKDTHFPKLSRSITAKNKAYLEQILNESTYIEEVFISAANFVLVKLKDINASVFQEHLSKYKIMIRDCSNFEFLDNSFVRIAVKSSDNLQVLKLALESINNDS